MRISKAKSLAAMTGVAAVLLVLGAAGAAAQSIPLAAHRAFYELVLDPSKPGMKVDGARGRIVYEVTGSACTGWAITLRQVTELNSGEGKRTVSDLRSTTWEDGDAKSYRFKTQNFLDQEIREEVDGTLDRAKDGLAVRLTKPKSERLTLQGNILLPTEHIRKLLVAAAAGERTLEAKVFDGSPDGKRIYDTLSVLGAVVAGDRDLEEASRQPELGTLKRYPVTISYFEPGTGERTPTYVLGFELYENGVSRALRLDYGSFAMRGELKTIEFLKSTPCKR